MTLPSMERHVLLSVQVKNKILCVRNSPNVLKQSDQNVHLTQ